jgi:hypothetical protein
MLSGFILYPFAFILLSARPGHGFLFFPLSALIIHPCYAPPSPESRANPV